MPPRARWVLLARGLAVSLSVTAVLILGIEGAARLALRLRLVVVPSEIPPGQVLDGASHAIWAARRTENLLPTPQTDDLDLLWRNRPGGRKTQPVNPKRWGLEQNWTVAIDSRGYRGGELSLAHKSPGTYRILCIGDSITFGFSVDQDATYPARLQARLEHQLGPERLQVINAGVPGWSWEQGLRFLEVEGLALEPDLVVIAHGTNDQFFSAQETDTEKIDRRRDPAFRRNYRLAEQFGGTATFQVLRALLAVPPAPTQPGPSAGCVEQTRTERTCRRVSLARIAEIIADIQRLTAARGIDLLLLNLDFMQTAATRASAPAAARLGIPHLDLVTRFRGLQRAAADARATDLHLAPEGPMSGGAPSSDAPGTTASGPQRRALLRVTGTPSGVPLSVRGQRRLSGDSPFVIPLRDDGQGGDETAADGVASAVVVVPAAVEAIEYKFYAGDEPELLPLPPYGSTMGARVLGLPADRRGPVDVFGDLPMMAEQTHPDARGQAVIADAVAAHVESLASFRAARATAAEGR